MASSDDAAAVRAAAASRMPEFLNLEEVEELARGVMPKMAYDYYRGGSDTCYSVAENRRAFNDYQLVPRMLVDVSRLDTRTSLWGMQMSSPIMVAPMAMHGLAHEGREVATCKAAAAEGLPFVFSTVATSSFEEIAGTGNSAIIYQLYVVRDRGVVRRWVSEAEARGFKALMVTVDAQRLGRREADERNRFTLPAHLQLKNLQYLDSGSVTQARESGTGSGLMALFGAQVDASLTWDFLPWLRSVTRLPILVKGLLCGDDAARALAVGVDGIVVSNHGGRQMDYAPAPLSVLAEVAAVVRGRVPVLMDGGVRRGTDVLKALALGASGVLVGRPVLYGLALGGQEGAQRVLALLKAELELAMALAGCPSLDSIGPHLLRPAAPAAATAVLAAQALAQARGTGVGACCGCAAGACSAKPACQVQSKL